MLTAKVSDAVREFVRSAGIAVDTENGELQERVIEAGESMAHGLGLLVSTQFGEKVRWNSSAIRTQSDRWRVEFIWGLGESEEFDDLEPSEEIGDELDDESDEVQDDESDEIEEIGVMAR